jgi:DNA-binding transcriptional LysR family regulator
MNTTQIKYFLSLVRTKNITQTANQMFVSPSTISKNIHKLENFLGTKLIKPGRRGVELTTSGEFFYIKAKRIYKDIDDTITDIRNSNLKADEPITVASTGSLFEIEFLSQFIQTLDRKLQPRINLEIFDPNDGNSISTSLIQGRYDFVIYQKDFFIDKKDIIFEPVFSTGLSVITSKKNSLSQKASLNIKDLAKENVYIWNSVPPLPLINHFKFELALKYPEFIFKNINDEVVLEILCASNQCLGIVPSVLYDKVNENLNFILLNYHISFENGIAYRKGYEQKEYFNQVFNALKNAELIEKKNWID